MRDPGEVVSIEPVTNPLPPGRVRPDSLVTDDLELLHTREYDTQVFLKGDDHLVVRGTLRDTKPPGMYVSDDPDPLDIHEMHMELLIALDGLVITQAQNHMATHPNEDCPAIETAYEALVGLSIARGFNRKVRELFGGPRGCAHTTTLLQAMAPAVMQSLWSVEVLNRRKAGWPVESRPERGEDHPGFRTNLNTCHIWDEEGEHVVKIRSGEARRVPIQISQRLKELGRDDTTWT